MGCESRQKRFVMTSWSVIYLHNDVIACTRFTHYWHPMTKSLVLSVFGMSEFLNRQWNCWWFETSCRSRYVTVILQQHWSCNIPQFPPCCQTPSAQFSVGSSISILSLKTESRHDAELITGRIGASIKDSFRRRHWRQIKYHDNSQ